MLLCYFIIHTYITCFIKTWHDMMSGRDYSLCNGSLGYAQTSLPKTRRWNFYFFTRGLNPGYQTCESAYQGVSEWLWWVNLSVNGLLFSSVCPVTTLYKGEAVAFWWQLFLGIRKILVCLLPVLFICLYLQNEGSMLSAEKRRNKKLSSKKG